MPNERYDHIFLDKKPDRQDYTKPPQKIEIEKRLPDRVRGTHSAYLEKRFNETWDSFKKNQEERKAVVHVERHGAYIEFEGAPGYELNTKSLEDFVSKTKARLRNVRSEGKGASRRTFATVYVPDKKRSAFLKKIREYADPEKKTLKGHPKNEALVRSISDIRLAVLESFWRPKEREKIPGDNPDWIEVWVSTEREKGIGTFTEITEKLQIDMHEGEIKFPERIVKLIRANKKQLESLIEASDDIAEFRTARELATNYTDMPPAEQARLTEELLERCSFQEDTDVSVCILDSGVNNGHDLIIPVLSDGDLHTVKPEWKIDDDHNHGTLMAGIVIYGDLLDVLYTDVPVYVSYVLESSKIIPPKHKDHTPKELWGDMTAQGIYKAEIKSPERKRIICQAVTAPDDVDRGKPSSWSGMVDALSSGYGEEEKKRLIIISAGNVDSSGDWRNYPEANKTKEVEDPAQAWNALTVGAFTMKADLERLDSSFDDHGCVAPSGGLSPYSRTSLSWASGVWPIKPEVVFEGGNIVRTPDYSSFYEDPLSLLSTYSKPHEKQFDNFWGTSAATALASRMAAQIQAHYPQAWPETIRALIVHSAKWTEAMKRDFLTNESKTAYGRLLRVCGYGVPDLERALYCMSNSLTLVSQAELQPYRKSGSTYATKDMNIYELPWPKDALLGLADTRVKMRITLSYFVEPGPENIGWNNRYKYSSFALRLSLNNFDETKEMFEKRINKKAREEGERPDTNSPSDHWTIGSNARDVGSIHSDIWKGSAAELATSNLIGVYPISGWWKERTNLKQGGRKCRYSLVVSIYTPEVDVDIYTPVATQVHVPTPVPVEIPVGRRRRSE